MIAVTVGEVGVILTDYEYTSKKPVYMGSFHLGMNFVTVWPLPAVGITLDFQLVRLFI